ncbi:hypothetical protein HDE_05466 [Halotydeus destructor]|nr:hypothetical protein HDE_05466 [Halotydeus destructor]
MGNQCTQCLNPETVKETATSTARELMQTQLRTGKVDESDVLNVLGEQFKRILKPRTLPSQPEPAKDVFNVSHMFKGDLELSSNMSTLQTK